MSDEKNNIFGKNINTGTNYGHIGDKIEGVKPRIFTENDLNALINEIKLFRSENQNLIENDIISIETTNDAESHNFANQIQNVLTNAGYEVARASYLSSRSLNVDIEITDNPLKSVAVRIQPIPNLR